MIDFFIESFKSVSCNVLSSAELPSLLQNVGLVVLTMLIPLIIATIQDMLAKETGNEVEKIEVKNKKLTLIEEVWGFRSFLWVCIGFSMSVILLYGSSDCTYKFKIFSIGLLSLWIILIRSFRVYRWVKGGQSFYTTRYLERISRPSFWGGLTGGFAAIRDTLIILKSSFLKRFQKGKHKDFENFWRHLWMLPLWKDDDGVELNYREQVLRIVIFQKKVSELIDHGNVNAASTALADFSENIQSRPLVVLTVFDEVLPVILEWHYQIWRKEYELLVEVGEDADRRGLSEWSQYADLSRIIDDIFRKIEKRVLVEGSAYQFFEYLKKHIDKYAQEKVSGKGNAYQYLEQVPMYDVFFENIADSEEKYDIERNYFPKAWKISIKNLRDKKYSNIVIVWFNHFMSWMNDRKNHVDKDGYDKKLDDVARILFPNVNPIAWSWILTFIMHGGGRIFDGNRMKSLIEGSKTFGMWTGMAWFPATADASEEDIESERRKREETVNKNTVRLAVFVFKQYFLKIDEYIDELKALDGEYTSDREKEISRVTLLEIFMSIKDELKK